MMRRERPLIDHERQGLPFTNAAFLGQLTRLQRLETMLSSLSVCGPLPVLFASGNLKLEYLPTDHANQYCFKLVHSPRSLFQKASTRSEQCSTPRQNRAQWVSNSHRPRLSKSPPPQPPSALPTPQRNPITLCAKKNGKQTAKPLQTKAHSPSPASTPSGSTPSASPPHPRYAPTRRPPTSTDARVCARTGAVSAPCPRRCCWPLRRGCPCAGARARWSR